MTDDKQKTAITESTQTNTDTVNSNIRENLNQLLDRLDNKFRELEAILENLQKLIAKGKEN